MDATVAWIVGAVIALLAGAAASILLRERQRSRRLRVQFGPEYDRTLRRMGGNRRAAEAVLLLRRRQFARTDVQPLGPQTRNRFAGAWFVIEKRFLRFPAQSLAQADQLVKDLMTARGYPMTDFERRAGEISVHHATLVRNFRAARSVADRTGRKPVTAEESKRAVGYYRALFEELLGPEPPRLKAAR